MYQTRKTRRLLAQGEITDGRSCVICGRRVPRRSAFALCNQPHCQRRFVERYGSEVD
jgi:hypothetical protein